MRILSLSALLLPLSGCSLLYDALGGAFEGEPSELLSAISPGARKLLLEALDGIEGPGIEGPCFVDAHVHMVSREVHPSWLSWWHPILRARTMVYLSAAGVEWTDRVEDEFVERLVALARELPRPARIWLYALDRHHRPDGTVDLDRTQLHVPNEMVAAVARRYPDVFVPVVSIHPYRADALEELDRWAAEGCRLVKWLPNSMGMDPSSPLCDPFYARMRELGMALLSHTGHEAAVEADDLQHLGNPLLLRRPLEAGLTVVALHAASDGTSVDLDRLDREAGDDREDRDDCEVGEDREVVPSHTLLLRMLDDPAHEGRLFADTSALTFANHLPEPLVTLLGREDLHPRLIHGSDYPLCALNVVIRTSRLVAEGLITERERGYLNEIYAYNPLVFDLVVKRTVRHPRTGRRFSPEVFALPPQLRALGGIDGMLPDPPPTDAPVAGSRGAP